MRPTRFPNGINNSDKSGPLRNLGMLDPTRLFGMCEDFSGNMSFPLAASGLAAASNGTWTITVTEAGAGDASSAVADINGGGITLTTDAADNDLIFVQHKNACFTPTAGKKSFFKMKFGITDANAVAESIKQTEWYCGLMVRDTDPLSSTGGDGVTDGIFFMKEDGTQDIYLYCQKNTTTGQLATKMADTLTVNTQTEFAFYFDGDRYIEVFVNGVKSITADLTTTPSAYLPDTVLNLSFGIKNGEAVAKVMTIDYIMVAQER
jgi:hypothetical protein